MQQEFPHLENLASKVKYPHFPTSFENVLRVKFGNDCSQGEQHELVIKTLQLQQCHSIYALLLLYSCMK